MNITDNDKDKLSFAEETHSSEPVNQIPWKILIVDDEIEVHHITEIVFSNVRYREKPIKLIHANSGEEALIKVRQEEGIAVVLLDVVMETENAGLIVARKIREDLGNKEIRIILRTGHPGYAPENKIILDYDINDYKEKTELTSQKLVTSVVSALRSYEDIMKLKEFSQNLELLVEKRTIELEETNKTLNSSLKKLRDDLEAGRRLQFRLLPQRDKIFAEYTFNRFLIPSLYLSGDFVDYFQIDEDHVGFYFVDVCGHGASSAFVTILLKSLIDNYIRDNNPNSIEPLKNPAEFLELMNMQILSEEFDKHLTLFYGVIDLQNNVLTFAHGGQFPHPIIFNGITSLFLDNKGGMPLGLYKDAVYCNHSIVLDQNFIFVVFSDGILEILPQESLAEKQDYLLTKIRSVTLTPSEILKSFGIDKDLELKDDITFLIIKR